MGLPRSKRFGPHGAGPNGYRDAPRHRGQATLCARQAIADVTDRRNDQGKHETRIAERYAHRRRDASGLFG